MSEWWEAIKTIPGAIKAITSVVGAVGDVTVATVRIGTAKANQIATRIDNETKLQSEATQALAAAMKGYVANNANDLGKRALQHAAAKMVEQQANREAVAVKAIQDLSEHPPKDLPSDSGPADDWLNLFGAYAERASSERMREHWAQILSGEIRKPGAFSFAALQIASLLDVELAKAIQRVAPWIIDGYVPVEIDRLDSGPFYRDLLDLDAIGFLRVGGGSHFLTFGPASAGKRGLAKINLTKEVLLIWGAPGEKLRIKAAFVTPAGRQLLSIMHRVEHPDLPSLLEEAITKKMPDVIFQRIPKEATLKV